MQCIQDFCRQPCTSLVYSRAPLGLGVPGGSSLVKYSASASTGRQPSSVFAFSLSYTCPAAAQPTTIRQSNLDDRNGARRAAAHCRGG
eukprot:COSAG04_NODE_1078_length_8422_cov_5.090833_5_plen_88_part_00